MKICTKCNKEKEIKNFSFKSRAKQTYQPWCRECHNTRHREMWKTHPNYRNRTIERNKLNRKSRQDYCLSYLKTQSCKDCGNTDYRVLEFDHLFDKVKGVLELACECAPIKMIQKEMDKCEVVCANCHKIRTYSRIPNCARY